MVIIFCLSTHNSLIEDTATHKLLINVLHTNIIVIMVVQSWSRLQKKPVESFWRSSDVIPKLSMKIRQIFRRSKVFYSFWPWQQTRLFRFYELFLSHQYLFFFAWRSPSSHFIFINKEAFWKCKPPFVHAGMSLHMLSPFQCQHAWQLACALITCLLPTLYPLGLRSTVTSSGKSFP